MAHIRSGSIVSDIRGKVGTEIYSRNRGGAYVKAYAAPVQPNTAAQLAARADTASAVAAWQALTDQDRIAWNNYASGANGGKGAFEKLHKTGYQLFMQRKKNLLQGGFSNDPSPIDPESGQTSNSRVSIPNDFTMDLIETADVQNLRISHYLYASPPVTASIMSPNSTRFAYINRYGYGTSFTFGIESPYQAVWGSISGLSGMKIFFKIRQIKWAKNFISGESSTVYIGAQTSLQDAFYAIINP